MDIFTIIYNICIIDNKSDPNLFQPDNEDNTE